MGNMRDLNEFASADHMSLAKMQDACHAALENVYGSEFTDALESGYDLNAESHDCASGSAVLETCDTTRAEQPTNHVKGGAIGMSRFHSNRTCIRSPTAIPSSQNTPLC